jgi:hypothetical protein
MAGASVRWLLPDVAGFRPWGTPPAPLAAVTPRGIAVGRDDAPLRKSVQAERRRGRRIMVAAAAVVVAAGALAVGPSLLAPPSVAQPDSVSVEVPPVADPAPPPTPIAGGRCGSRRALGLRGRGRDAGRAHSIIWSAGARRLTHQREITVSRARFRLTGIRLQARRPRGIVSSPSRSARWLRLPRPDAGAHVDQGIRRTASWR